MVTDPAIKAEAQKYIAKAKAMEAWLLKQDPDAGPVLSARLALRCLPLIVNEIPTGALGRKERHRIVMTFRYAALAGLTLSTQGKAVYDICTTLNTVAYRRMNVVEASVRSASRAAACACRSHRPFENSAYEAGQALRFASFIFEGEERERPWTEAESDQAWLLRRSWFLTRRKASSLLDEPLWLAKDRNTPLPEPYKSAWASLRASLLEDDDSWGVWVNWYEDRVTGTKSSSQDVEFTRVSLIPPGEQAFSDPSPNSQQLWRSQLEMNESLLRNDARKANRLLAKMVGTTP
ncbi:hypothetical protein [Rhizobium oryzicola]|uniref:Uncharacterized protein n=1 Tax=Rhizobium oryzicola TaxID=1232668 RepID=A0ABT8T4H2_9HYPH|nr:hypothetical protein [Rhizobium oryzicola]MDO1585654.1 hypothetical protein [Rhizobium oryzicola]